MALLGTLVLFFVAWCFCGGSGDPHFVGPNGERFDFNGQSGGVYTVISSKHYAVNILLDKIHVGVKNRFMKKIAVTISNVTVVFDTIQHGPNFMPHLNAILAPVDASASYYKGSTYDVAVKLCGEEGILISQEFTTPEWEHIANITENMYYLNFNVNIPGCHDDYAGILGQLYQCKYVNKEIKLEWHEELEENFRVAALETPSGAFTRDGPCLAPHEIGTAAGPAGSRMRL